MSPKYKNTHILPNYSSASSLFCALYDVELLFKVTLLLNKEPDKNFRLELIKQILTKVILAKIFYSYDFNQKQII